MNGPQRCAIATFPVGLRVDGRKVLIVGAGRIAARKARALQTQGALLTVVAPRHSAEMDSLEVASRHIRAFRPGDVDSHWFVVAATGDAPVDRTVFRAAEERRVWCNAADDPENCSAVLPAVARRGDITVSVATGGRSPATASWLRRRIEALLDEDTLAVFEVAALVRERLRSAGRPTEVPGWAEVLDDAALELSSSGRITELEELLADALSCGAPGGVAPSSGSVRP